MKGAIATVCALFVVGTVTVATASASPGTRPPTRAVAAGYGVVKVIICIGAIGSFIAGGVVLALKLKKAGGIIKLVRKLWKARTAEERAVVVGKVFGTLTGAGGLIEVCAP